jgi:ABC-type Zn uptake system ZnuABC Zn-binding protein ZnuA
MKKLFCVVIIVICIICVTGCSSNADSKQGDGILKMAKCYVVWSIEEPSIYTVITRPRSMGSETDLEKLVRYLQDTDVYAHKEMADSMQVEKEMDELVAAIKNKNHRVIIYAFDYIPLSRDQIEQKKAIYSIYISKTKDMVDDGQNLRSWIPNQWILIDGSGKWKAIGNGSYAGMLDVWLDSEINRSINNGSLEVYYCE